MNKTIFNRFILLGLCLCFSLYIVIVFRSPLVNDDYMAIYTAWLLSEDKIAGFDFNVDSYSLLFDVMAPAYYLVGEKFSITYLFRFIFLFSLIVVNIQLYYILNSMFVRTVACSTIFFLWAHLHFLCGVLILDLTCLF